MAGHERVWHEVEEAAKMRIWCLPVVAKMHDPAAELRGTAKVPGLLRVIPGQRAEQVVDHCVAAGAGSVSGEQGQGV